MLPSGVSGPSGTICSGTLPCRSVAHSCAFPAKPTTPDKRQPVAAANADRDVVAFGSISTTSYSSARRRPPRMRIGEARKRRAIRAQREIAVGTRSRILQVEQNHHRAEFRWAARFPYPPGPQQHRSLEPSFARSPGDCATEYVSAEDSAVARAPGSSSARPAAADSRPAIPPLSCVPLGQQRMRPPRNRLRCPELPSGSLPRHSIATMPHRGGTATVVDADEGYSASEITLPPRVKNTMRNAESPVITISSCVSAGTSQMCVVPGRNHYSVTLQAGQGFVHLLLMPFACGPAEFC